MQEEMVEDVVSRLISLQQIPEKTEEKTAVANATEFQSYSAEKEQHNKQVKQNIPYRCA